MASASPENSGSGQALADIPAEPSRGHCSHGLLHGTDAYVWDTLLFFVIGHDRRKILRFNVTRNPSAFWIVQQMREAWPYAPAHRFLLLDRDSKFGVDVVSAIRGMGSKPIRTAFRSPWQNGVAERWVADATCWTT